MPTQPMITGVTSYELTRDLDAIVDDGEQGFFFSSARLVDQILRDARIYSTLMTRIQGLLGKPLEFEAADVRAKSQAKNDAEELESIWPHMLDHQTLVELKIWGLMHNSGLAQIVEDEDPWRLEWWHPWSLGWDEYARQYFVQTRKDPRLYIERDGEGGFRDTNGTRWCLYTPFGYGNTRRGYLRSCYRLYLERQWAHRDRSRYSEVYGQPMRIGIAPAAATDVQTGEFKKRLRLGSEAVMVVRHGLEGNQWDVKLVEALGKSASLFNDTIAQLDREVATLLLGQSQTTDGQAGLGSNDQAGELVRLDIIRSDGNVFSDSLRAQFLCPYWKFAHGNAERAPWPRWRVDPPEDRAKKALEFKTLMEAFTEAKNNGAPIDVECILEDYGIDTVEPNEQPQQPQTPQNPAQTPQNPANPIETPPPIAQ